MSHLNERLLSELAVSCLSSNDDDRSAVTAFSETFVEIIVETRDHDHLRELQSALTAHNVKFEFHAFKFYETD